MVGEVSEKDEKLYYTFKNSKGQFATVSTTLGVGDARRLAMNEFWGGRHAAGSGGGLNLIEVKPKKEKS